MSEKQNTVKRVLDAAPGSFREIARAASVSHSLLSQVCSGQRNATPELLGALAKALETWGGTCLDGAEQLRKLMEENK